jgi:hypothetical protein
LVLGTWKTITMTKQIKFLRKHSKEPPVPTDT